jgi:ATP-dependent Clp protease adaptor protein ClpS
MCSPPGGFGRQNLFQTVDYQYNGKGNRKLLVLRFFEEKMSDHAAAAVAEEPTGTVVPQRRKQEKREPKKQPRYNVVLWNDDDHTYAYVITMLLEIFAYPVEKGYQMAQEVDNQGRVVVLTTTMEHAELKRDQIHAYGKDALIAGCQGSMSASIEPVEG